MYNIPRGLTVPTYDLEGKYACRAGGSIGGIHIHPEAIPIFVPVRIGLTKKTQPCQGMRWALLDSNQRHLACKASALNQLS